MWLFSLILDHPTRPTIGARGSAVIPYTKIRANIGPVTPAQWMLTFQNTLIPMQMIETNREPKANRNMIFVLVAEKIMAAVA